MKKLWPEYGSRSYNLYSSPIHKKELILAVHWKVSTYQRSLRLGFYSLEHVHTRHATPLFEHMFEPSRARAVPAGRGLPKLFTLYRASRLLQQLQQLTLLKGQAMKKKRIRRTMKGLVMWFTTDSSLFIKRSWEVVFIVLYPRQQGGS